MGAPLLLTADDLHQLTGYQQPARMCAWLQARGWVFEPPTRRGDIPKVATLYYEHRMTGRALAGTPRRTEPRLDFFAEA